MTIGPRVALDVKKNTVLDVNFGSTVIASGSAEVTNSGLQKDGFWGPSSKEGKSNSGFSFGAPVGALDGLPVSLSGAKTTENTFIGQRRTSTTITGSASTTVTGLPIGVYGSTEITRSGGVTTNTYRLAPVNYGLTIGAGIVGEFNIDFGLKIKYNKNDEWYNLFGTI